MAREDLIQRYEDARKRYENRIKSWVKKFHAIVKPIPRVKYAKNITEKSIERLEKETWPKISERKKKEARKEYEVQYENRAPTVYTPKPPYNPPTEADFLNNIPDTSEPLEELDEEPDEDGYTPTVDSRAELAEWIDENIKAVELNLPDREIIRGVAEQLERYTELAFWQAEHYDADISYLAYLEENSGKFNELALKAIHGYESKGTIYYIEQGGSTALSQFVTLLNFGKPLSPAESASYDESNIFGSVFEEKYGQ